MQFRWVWLVFAAATVAGAREADAGGCPIPGFTNAAFADVGGFNGRGTTDSWDSSCGAYNSAGCPRCTDPTSCNDTNACSAGVGTNASSFGSTPTTSGSCTANAGVTLTMPAVPASPAPTALGAISGTTTISTPAGGGSYTATSISESGNGALNFVTAGASHGPAVVYVSGSITFSGNGALNNDSLNPSYVLIVCTNTSTSPRQQVTLNGNGNAYFGLYCPNADITLNGGGSGGVIYGAIVGYSIQGNGNHAVDIHYDRQMASMTTNAVSCGGEVARSSPVLPTIDSATCATGSSCTAVVQGTFQRGTATSFTSKATMSGWSFPYITGHMRAREADGSTNATGITTTASTYSTGTILFDAAASGKIPARNNNCAMPLSGACRYIFTNTNTPNGTTTFARPTSSSVLAWNDTNAPTLGALVAPSASYTGMTSADYVTLSQKILTASLGGIDRSTVAVIQASPYTSSPSRPTMAYFGAADGMLHAVCAGTGGTTASQTSSVCPSLGTELWAFMPRVQLPLLPSNAQRIDGSVRVVDAYGDFSTTTGTGTKSWRTILVFQTGFSRAAVAPAAKAPPAAYAIDVTDPASPVLLWEYSTPSSPAANDFGTGMRAAVGPVLVNNTTKYMAWLETNNGGSAATTAPGVVLQAINLDTGTSAWTFSSAYPSTSVPYQAVPGGAVGVDLTRNGFFTDVIFGDLYGWAWRLDAATGTSKTGSASTPLFKFTYAQASDKHPIGAPPAIYSDGTTQYAAFVAGGYADQADGATSWSVGTHSLVAVKVNASSYPVLDTATACSSCDLRIFRNLDAGTKAYAQPTVVGNQLFAVSDAADVNSVSYGSTGTATGHVLAVNGLNGNESFTSYGTSTVYGGASSLTAATINGSVVLIGSSSDKQVKLGTAATSGTGTGIGAANSAQGTGTVVDLNAVIKVTRLLWFRIE